MSIYAYLIQFWTLFSCSLGGLHLRYVDVLLMKLRVEYIFDHEPNFDVFLHDDKFTSEVEKMTTLDRSK